MSDIPEGYLPALSGAAIITTEPRACDTCGRQVHALMRFDKEGEPSKLICLSCAEPAFSEIFKNVTQIGGWSDSTRIGKADE